LSKFDSSSGANSEPRTTFLNTKIHSIEAIEAFESILTKLEADIEDDSLTLIHLRYLEKLVNGENSRYIGHNSLKSLSEKDKPIDKSSYKLHIGEEKATEIDQKLIDRLGAKVHQVGQKIVIEFPGVSFFDIGKIDLRSEGVRMLSDFVTAYLPFAGKYSLGVHSFTDTRQVLRTKHRRFNDNLELSALRSVAAMRVLQSRGIPLNAMRISGLGELEVTSEQLKASGVNLLSGDPRDLARKVVLVVEPAVERGGKG
jgi:flagellar motor protein MotB